MRVEPIYLTWLNNLGGFEYFLFTGKKDYNVEVINSGQIRQNIFPNWPKSYGEYADTIDKQTFRQSKNSQIVRSQYLTLNQVEALSQIRTSPLVQIIVSRTDRRTVIIDTDSFKKYSEDDNEKVFSMQFKIMFTDDIPSQSL
jgi:hypothetical protein